MSSNEPALAADRLNIASVVDQVYAAIRERISSGSLARGSRVHQEDLAEELGVSRTPVREALRRLAAEGLVEMRTNRGARVADIDQGSMRGAYEARLVVEPGAARLAAQRRPGEPLARMRAAVHA
jgi:DNA-binding GntR family transcriptional regulator